MISRPRLVALPGGVTTIALAAALALDTSDQSAIGASAPEVRDAFGVGSDAIGLLATSSTLVGVALTIPYGILADRVHRLRTLRATVVVWTLGTVAVAVSPSFAFMLGAHAVLGLVTGAGLPLAASLVGDLVPPEDRGRVYSVLLLGELSGAALGLAVSGEIAALFGWREAYFVLAVFGLFVLWALHHAVEPPRRAASRRRGRATREADDTTTFVEALQILMRNRTNVVLIGAGRQINRTSAPLRPASAGCRRLCRVVAVHNSCAVHAPGHDHHAAAGGRRCTSR